MLKIITNNADETYLIAKKIARVLKLPFSVYLDGDMASGKSVFARGICDYFNLSDDFSSPTYAIVNEYTNSKIKIYHMDAYRIEDINELSEIGFFSINEENIIIEWANIIKEALNKNGLYINIKNTYENLDERIINIKSKDKELIKKIKEIL